MFISDFGKSPVNLIESIGEEFYAVQDQQGNPHIVGLPSGADAEAGREYLASNQYTVLTGPMESIDAVKLFFKKQLLEHAIAQIKKQLAESSRLHTRYKRNRFKSLDQRRQEEEYLLRQAMLDVSNENKGSLEEIDRRGFLKGLGAAALAGATGMSAAGDLEDKIGPLPIMATIKLRLSDGTVKTIKKDLGHAYDYRLDDAKKDLEDLLNRKGIKNYSIHLDRYKDNSAYLDRETNPAAADYVDRTPLKGSTSDRASDYMDNKPYKSPKGDKTYMDPAESVEEAAKKGLYYNVNKRKKAGTSRPAGHPKAPTAQAWKDAAKTAKNESVAEARDGDTNFGSTVTRGSWVVYDGGKVKRFKSREGAKAYAEKNGGKVASSEFYADKIQGKKGIAEGSKYKCSCHSGDPDPDCPVHGLEPMEVGDALHVKKGVAEGLNEFAPNGFNGGDDDEGFSPEIAKMAQEDGFHKRCKSC
jgi:L-rhamnose mutarotase